MSSQFSWSANAAGTPGDMKELLDGMIRNRLETFDPKGKMVISVGGHMECDDCDKKTGCRQNINISISAAA